MNNNIITKISNGFCKIEKTITWITFAIMLALLLIQVFCRYFLHMPLAWAEELVRYTYIAVSFIGAVVALRERGHISIDILPSLIESRVNDERKKRIMSESLDILANLPQMLLFIAMSIWMILYNKDIASKNQITTANQWPMWAMCLPVTISCMLMAFHGFMNILEDILILLQVSKRKVGE